MIGEPEAKGLNNRDVFYNFASKFNIQNARIIIISLLKGVLFGFLDENLLTKNYLSLLLNKFYRFFFMQHYFYCIVSSSQ
jgi:hypothetical protein